jgi:hypothetical protein
MNGAVVVTGSRSVPADIWRPLVHGALDRLYDVTERMVMLHGDCPDPMRKVILPDAKRTEMISIDQEASRWARRHPLVDWPFPALWETYGKKAGPMRNELMIDTLEGLRKAGWTTQVVAFHPDIDNSAGTRGCVRYAISKGLLVNLRDLDGWKILTH